jgi:hypothetical protein
MKTLLEIFYLRVVDDEVRYQRRQVSLSGTQADPDRVIHSLIRRKFHTPAGEVEEEFVVHSTSWRYAPPGEVILTYVAYSDELEFDAPEFKTLPLERLRMVDVSTPRPRSPDELEKQVVSHAMRHLAFLVKTDDENTLARVLTPETRKVFEALWVALAGRVY